MRPVVLLAGLLCISPGCMAWKFNQVRHESRTIDAQQVASLDLSTFNGTIKVVPHDQPTIEMEITYKAYGATEAAAEENCNALDCEVVSSDSAVTVKAIKPSGQTSPSISFAVKAPPTCALKLKSSNGYVSVHDFAADVDVHTSNGAIDLQRVTGFQSAHTSNGKIEIRDGIGRIDLSTSNGKVSYSGQLLGDQNEIQTSNGSVTLAIPPGGSTEVNARTSNGSVQCQLPITKVFNEGKNSMHAVVGNDGTEPQAKVSLGTSNGSIRIEQATIPNLPAEPPVTESTAI